MKLYAVNSLSSRLAHLPVEWQQPRETNAFSTRPMFGRLGAVPLEVSDSVQRGVTDSMASYPKGTSMPSTPLLLVRRHR